VAVRGASNISSLFFEEPSKFSIRSPCPRSGVRCRNPRGPSDAPEPGHLHPSGRFRSAERTTPEPRLLRGACVTLSLPLNFPSHGSSGSR
jgi:hypothetical protein